MRNPPTGGQPKLADNEQNAVYGRGDGGYDDREFRPGARDYDRDYGMERQNADRPGVKKVVPDPTETRSERDRRSRPAPARSDVETRGRRTR